MNAMDMLNGIDLTMEQLTKIKEMVEVKLAELTPKELKPIKQWEPKGGNCFVGAGGDVLYGDSMCQYRNFGTEYATKELAEKARDAMRVHNRLLAYRAEFDPDYVEPEWNKRNEHWCVYYNTSGKQYATGKVFSTRDLTVVYMSEQVAKDLVKKLNSGEVVL